MIQSYGLVGWFWGTDLAYLNDADSSLRAKLRI
jgi:hypothetical protein